MPLQIEDHGSGNTVTVARAEHAACTAGSSSPVRAPTSRSARVRIGDRCGFNGVVRLLLHEPAAITVGNDCLFAVEVDLLASDMHPVFNLASGGRINPAASITVGN